MPAYWMTNVEVTDPEAYGRYAKLAGPAIESFGGKFLVRGGQHKQLEGRERARNVIVEFADMATAEACYNSPAYQEALAHARDASLRDMVLVEGV